MTANEGKAKPSPLTTAWDAKKRRAVQNDKGLHFQIRVSANTDGANTDVVLA